MSWHRFLITAWLATVAAVAWWVHDSVVKVAIALENPMGERDDN
jgi:hypothetical protein